MTREEAEARAHELAAEDESHSYFARERGGDWQVVKLSAGPGRTKVTGTATEARPEPDANDPRTTNERLIPPFGGIPI
jgi:hypothetical protein